MALHEKKCQKQYKQTACYKKVVKVTVKMISYRMYLVGFKISNFFTGVSMEITLFYYLMHIFIGSL